MKTVSVSLRHNHQIVGLPVEDVPPELVRRMAEAMNRRIELSFMAMLRGWEEPRPYGGGVAYRADVT